MRLGFWICTIQRSVIRVYVYFSATAECVSSVAAFDFFFRFSILAFLFFIHAAAQECVCVCITAGRVPTTRAIL